MRIVIDLQGAQTDSRFRGIGRYSLSFTKEIIRNCGEHEVILALNGLLADSIESIRNEFDDLLLQEKIKVWYAPGPVRECEPQNKGRREAAELIREAFLASLQPDVVIITSLFEGYGDDAITSIGRIDKNTLVYVILYDLIPLTNPDYYFKSNQTYEHYYLRKKDSLAHATCLLSISKFSKDEGINFLSAQTPPIVNISCAVNTAFQPIKLDKLQTQSVLDKFGLTRKLVMYTGGFDFRKNLPLLLRSYAKLSTYLRDNHQLVFVGKIHKHTQSNLKIEAKSVGLSPDDLVFTGYVSDNDLVKLYNICKLFVFPSWHEGFGLPVLEAMSCGAAVIGANTSSLPELINNEDALFNPFSEESIAHKITDVLTKENLLQSLKKTGLRKSKLFSWDRVGKNALKALQSKDSRELSIQVGKAQKHRQRLAFVSPLPPEKTGIADYSAELLPALSFYYDIDVVVTQSKISDQWVKKNCQIRTAEYFLENNEQYDRVIYQFGNSPFHEYMYDLLNQIPGTICLHDFYISGNSHFQEVKGGKLHRWVKELYHSHGYQAIKDKYHLGDDRAVMIKYPCNLNLLQAANGVISHSSYSKELAHKWYGKKSFNDWKIIALLRQSKSFQKIENPRKICNVPDNAFVICSFGLLDPTKLNDRCLDAWLASDLSKNPNCYLIFVGENHHGIYGDQLNEVIKKSGAKNRVRITGWVSSEVFKAYLSIADIAIQLRTQSRGETSAAALDCMSYGIPTIVNANGSMAELSSETVNMLEDEFADTDLVQAIEKLWKGTVIRQSLSENAKKKIQTQHSPEVCAKHYFEAIEAFYNNSQVGSQHLITALAESNQLTNNGINIKNLAKCIAQNYPDKYHKKTIFIDVTSTCHNNLKTGIERVARSLLLQLITKPPKGTRVEPVYLSNKGHFWDYRYARKYTLELLECPNEWISDDVIEAQSGDILLAVDLSGSLVVDAEKAGVYKQLKNIGVNIVFTVYDLLPIKCSNMFPPNAEILFSSWLSSVCRISNNVVCISKAVADELIDWQSENIPTPIRPLKIDWFHLGADIRKLAPTKGILNNLEAQLKIFKSKPTFLMVGTIEPRKGHLQTIAAFEQLWHEGVDVNLVIVGNEGWLGTPNEYRRTIPSIIKKIRQHPELEKRLFWLTGVGDEHLEKLYLDSTCLIAASFGEGFGLPLIEAAQYGLPIIAREIPIFREVAGEYAFYFSGKSPKTLAEAIIDWLDLHKIGQNPNSDKLPWLTWEESARSLLATFINENKNI